MGFHPGVRRPESTPGDDIHADPDRLIRVAANLLSNAGRFSRPGRKSW
jgi:signal transduction histidine kinase